MRIKIGNKIYDGSEEPIMVIFDNKDDKESLRLALNNPKWQGKFSRNPINYFKTQEDKIKWMDDINIDTRIAGEISNLIGVEI